MWCFDFVDETGNRINKPDGWKLFTVPDEYGFNEAQAVPSIAAAAGLKIDPAWNLPPSTEYFMLSDGTVFSVEIPGRRSVKITMSTTMSIRKSVVRVAGVSGRME